MKKKLEQFIEKLFTSEKAEKVTRFMAWFIFGYFMAHVIVRAISIFSK